MSELPKISIVTPCLNHADFVEGTIQSVHGQGYTNLEHVIMDGGSTDGSLDIIQRYADRLTWASGPDRGQYAAIATGFARTSGEIMAWLNSDDIYLPGALTAVGEIFRAFPDVEWITTRFPMAIGSNGALIKMGCFPGFSKHHFVSGDFLPSCGWEAMGFIQQESTFWRRTLWERAGANFSEGLDYAGDFELWARFFQHSALYGLDVPLGCYRRHEAQKTSVAYEKYLDEARMVFKHAGGKPPANARQRVRVGLLRACGTSIGCRRAATRMGLLNDVRNITYDWASCSWIKEA